MPRHVIHTRRGHSKNEESESGWSGRAIEPARDPSPGRRGRARPGVMRRYQSPRTFIQSIDVLAHSAMTMTLMMKLTLNHSVTFTYPEP